MGVTFEHFAAPRRDLIPVLEIQALPNGVHVAIVPCADHDAFLALPGGIEIDSVVHGRSGWNSDRQVAYYRTDARTGRAR